MNQFSLLFAARTKPLLILTAVIFLLIPDALWATPMQIQFEGTVRRIDSGGYAPPGLVAGSHVSFTYVVDQTADGHMGGTVAVDTQYYDYFHAEQVGGLRILPAAADFYHRALRDSYWNQTKLYTGSSNEANDFWSSEEALPAGQYFYVGQYFYGNGGLLHPNYPTYSPYAFVRYDLNVTSISAVSDPVPEPASVLLFGAGLVGMAGAARRRTRNALRRA